MKKLEFVVVGELSEQAKKALDKFIERRDAELERIRKNFENGVYKTQNHGHKRT
jgi:hypothetical protein